MTIAHPELATTYLGLPLSGPIIASASPLTGRLDSLLKLQEAGAAAVVLPSLFEEEVSAEELQIADLLETGEEFPEFHRGPLPELDLEEIGTVRHMRLLEQAKAALQIPVIASLNATRPGSWQRFAAQMEAAGADAIELNLYTVAANPLDNAHAVEKRHLEAIAEVKSAIKIPLAVKLSPFYSSMASFAAEASAHGADGLVLFNRFYAPDIDLSSFEVVPKVDLSTSTELRLPLRWIGILRSQLPKLGLAATSGVHTAEDVIKGLLVGADVVCTTSGVLKHGPKLITDLIEGLYAWLNDNDYVSVDEMRGSASAGAVRNPGAFERSQYMAVITSLR